MVTFLTLLLLIIAAATVATALFLAASMVALAFTRVPYVPTPKKNIEKIFDCFTLSAGNRFYDLGCGDGRFVIAAARRGARAVGFEISPWAYLKARFNVWRTHVPAEIRYADFYHADLSDADAIFCFLITTVMPVVEKKLRQELKPGAQVVCYGFKLPTWPPEKIVELKPGKKNASKIYVYRQTGSH